MSDRQRTVGETLIDLLEANDVDVVFGIPGVHTVELYRGLAASNIRHVTPRHEQGAGFMADGYARVSGKPGVCLVITGPGLTNIITPMAQADAGNLRRQCARHARPRPRPAARTAGPARHDGDAGADVAHLA
jgi:glyoxylate carboligase